MLGVLLGSCLALATWGCPGNSNVPAGGDPERMSESEYDIARDLWLRQQKPREALAHVLKAVDLNEDNADATHLAALIYLDFCSSGSADCRLEEAEKHARAALSARKDFREAKNTLAVVLVHQKRYADAVAVLKPLTADILYQTPENAWGNLGWAYLELGQLDSAIDALRRAVAAQPLFCVGNLRLGRALEQKGQVTEALDAYTQALTTEAPGCSALQDAWLSRGKLHMKLGKSAEAASDLTRCEELSARTTAGKECRSIRTNLK